MLFSTVGNIISTLDLGGMMGMVEVVRVLGTGHAGSLLVSQNHLASPCLAFLLLPGTFKAELVKTRPLFMSDFPYPQEVLSVH